MFINFFPDQTGRLRPAAALTSDICLLMRGYGLRGSGYGYMVHALSLA